MKTFVFLNEGTQLIIHMNIEDFEKKIEEIHDKGTNFMTITDQVEIFFNKNCFPKNDIKSNNKFKLYIKRILFFDEIL